MPEYTIHTNNGFSNAALIFGVISVLTLISLRLPLSLTTGAFAIIFASLSHGRSEKSPPAAFIGLITGSISVASNVIFVIVVLFLFFNNTDFRTNVAKPYIQEFQKQYQEMLDSYNEDKNYNDSYDSDFFNNDSSQIFY